MSVRTRDFTIRFANEGVARTYVNLLKASQILSPIALKQEDVKDAFLHVRDAIKYLLATEVVPETEGFVISIETLEPIEGFSWSDEPPETP